MIGRQISDLQDDASAIMAVSVAEAKRNSSSRRRDEEKTFLLKMNNVVTANQRKLCTVVV